MFAGNTVAGFCETVIACTGTGAVLVCAAGAVASGSSCANAGVAKKMPSAVAVTNFILTPKLCPSDCLNKAEEILMQTQYSTIYTPCKNSEKLHTDFA